MHVNEFVIANGVQNFFCGKNGVQTSISAIFKHNCDHLCCAYLLEFFCFIIPSLISSKYKHSLWSNSMQLSLQFLQAICVVL